MFKKKEENKTDCRVKVGFTFYPDTSQILITYLQNCNSLLTAKYLCDRIYHQIDVDIKLNDTETFENLKEKAVEEVTKAEQEAKAKREENTGEVVKELPPPKTKEEKAQEIRIKKLAELKKKREDESIKFIAILDREAKQIVIKNSQNCELPYWINYIAWRVVDQSTVREIAQTTTMELIKSIINNKKKQNIEVPGA